MLIPVTGMWLLLLLCGQEVGRTFFFYPFFLNFHSSHSRVRPLAFPCPAALGVSDEELFPVGQKTVQDGLISLCFLKLCWCSTLWHHLSTQVTLRLVQSWWEFLSLDSRLDTGGVFHQALGEDIGKSQVWKYTRTENDEAVSDCYES